MSRLSLRYTSTLLTSLSYDEEATNQKEFQCLKLFPKRIITNQVNGSLLNGRQYGHIKFISKDIDFIIDSTELDNTAITFLKNFWTSNHKYYSLKSGGTFGNYQKCIGPGGEFPVNYYEDLIDFPEVSIKLIDEK